jgi:hypothetical protein
LRSSALLFFSSASPAFLPDVFSVAIVVPRAR